MAFLDRITTSSATCFGFIPLRAGTLILLWLSLIMAVLISTQSTKLMIMLSYLEGYVDKESNNLAKTLSLLALILALLSGICTLLGFYGVQFNRRPSFLQPFIYFGVVEAGIYALLIAGGILALFFGKNLEPYQVPDTVLSIFIQLCFLALKWHFVSVVYRYYEQWKADVKHNCQYGNADVAYCPNTIP